MKNLTEKISKYIAEKERLGEKLWDDEDDDFDKDGEAIYDQGRYQGWHEVCIDIKKIINEYKANS